MNIYFEALHATALTCVIGAVFALLFAGLFNSVKPRAPRSTVAALTLAFALLLGGLIACIAITSYAL